MNCCLFSLITHALVFVYSVSNRPSPVPCSKAPAGFLSSETPDMAAGRMNACPGWVDGRAWTRIQSHGGADEAIRDCACHGTLPNCGQRLLVRIQIKWAFPAARNLAALVLYLLAATRISDVHAFYPIACLVNVRRDAEAGCQNPSRVILCLNVRTGSQFKWAFDI